MVGNLPRFVVIVLALAAPLAQGATTVTAVHATEPGSADRTYDEGCQEFEELLSRLEYGRFDTVAQKNVTLATGAETRVTVNARYALSFTDTTVQADGHVKSTVRVFGLPRNASEPVEVLEMSVRLAPGKPVMIRGLRMEKGEIVVFLKLD